MVSLGKEKRETEGNSNYSTALFFDLMLTSGWASWHYFSQLSQQTQISHAYLHFRAKETEAQIGVAPSLTASVGRAGISRFNPTVYPQSLCSF